MRAVGILFPLSRRRAPRAPASHALGRAALALRDEGVACVVGDEVVDGGLTGFVAEAGRWAPVVRAHVAGLYHRFPSRSRAPEFEAIVRAAGGVPIANHPALVALCDDKLASQRVLVQAGVRMPEVEGEAARFAARLAAWGGAFVKPRFGAFGEGVVRVTSLPALDALGGPWIAQRAVPPPAGLAGISVRQLVQRAVGGGWVARAAVVRTSATDPVVNVARGARVGGPELLVPRVADEIAALSVAAARALVAACPGPAVEFGVDAVVDRDGVPWVIEVNGKPRGRLAVLAELDPERWSAAHLEACLTPLRVLAHGLADQR